MSSARAFWTLAPGVGAILEETLPIPGPDQHPIDGPEVTGSSPGVARDADPVPGYRLIRALASGVSRGTESLVFNGRVPRSQHEAMRAPLMAGSFPFPVKYGYALVGLDPDGARVFVLHPHQDLCLAPAAMCIPVPDAVPTARAVLAANMETALNITWDAEALPGERIMVIGAGVVGLLAASLFARIPATRVVVVDIDPSRAALAHRFGCEFATPDAAPEERELIVHASASEAGLRLALSHAAHEGRIVEASWYGDTAPAVPLGEAFHARRLRLLSSQVGGVAGRMRGRRGYADRLATALDLLVDPAYDALLEGPTPFERLPVAMPGILRPGGLAHVITYGAG